MSRFSSLVVVFLLCVTSSYAIKVVDVDTICKKVTNPSFCSTLLNSKPGGSGDLVSLAKYTIDVVRANVTNTINLINMLIAQSGSNVVAREHYKMCLYHFGDNGGAINKVEEAQQSLKTGDYRYAIQSASIIGVDVSDCISGESPTEPPYHDTSLLPKYAEVVDRVAEIIVSILNYLIQA